VDDKVTHDNAEAIKRLQAERGALLREAQNQGYVDGMKWAKHEGDVKTIEWLAVQAVLPDRLHPENVANLTNEIADRYANLFHRFGTRFKGVDEGCSTYACDYWVGFVLGVERFWSAVAKDVCARS
jgi:hypothetical protein